MSDSSTRKAVLTWALVALAAATLVAHMRRFDFVTDDAFISFVYSRNLAEHGQLVFNLGERVEGYTNFLWTVLLAGLMKLGWQPESSSVALGTSFAVATQALCAVISRRVRRAQEYSPWDALPAWVLALASGYACWSSGGLETQMFTFLVTLGFGLHLHELDTETARPWSAAAFGLAALTRPEGILFFGLAGLHKLLHLVGQKRFVPSLRDVAWVGLFLAFVVPHFLWRKHYYGWWLPNTFYIKSSGGHGTWERGLYYLRRFAEAHLVWALGLVALVGAPWVRERRERRLLGLTAIVVPVFFAYIASVGGDFMGLFRFALPVLPLIVMAAAVGLRAPTDKLSDKMKPVAALVPIVLLVGYAIHADAVDKDALKVTSDNGIDTPGYLRAYTHNRAEVGKWMARQARPDDYAAVGGAGAQVYYSRIPSLDCFGLSDAYIAHHVQASNNRPGHEKYAPLEYQLSKHPTIITSNYYRIGDRPRCCPAISPGEDAEWRRRGYQYVTVELPGLVPEAEGAPKPSWYTFLKRADRSFGPYPAVSGEID